MNDIMNNIERAQRFILDNEWIFAKTMAYIPHWYCLRERYGNFAEYAWFVDYMRKNSLEGKFGNRTFQYFYLNGYKYWDMDDTVESCDLINRDKYKKDFIDEYEYEFKPLSIFDREFLASYLSKAVGRVLDINCGDGVLLDIITPEKYIGVDNRLHLLKLCREKTKYNANYKLYLEKFEHLFFGRFDTIVSLFGLTSKLPPLAIDRMFDSAKSDTKFLLMFTSEPQDRRIVDSLERSVYDNRYIVYSNITL